MRRVRRLTAALGLSLAISVATIVAIGGSAFAGPTISAVGTLASNANYPGVSTLSVSPHSVGNPHARRSQDRFFHGDRERGLRWRCDHVDAGRGPLHWLQRA